MALLGQLDTPSATTLAVMPCLSVDALADPFIGDCENQLMESEFLCLLSDTPSVLEKMPDLHGSWTLHLPISRPTPHRH